MTSLEKKYQIFDKALNAIFKLKVILYSNSSSTYTVRINLTSVNYKDFIYTIQISDFNIRPLSCIIDDIVNEFCSYIEGFYLNSDNYNVVDKLLRETEKTDTLKLIDKALTYTE